MANRDLQLVTFFIGPDRYGVDIMSVEEIVRLQEVRQIPGAPAYVAGIRNLRGDIVPIVDLHNRFRIARPPDSEQGRLQRGLMIVSVADTRIGVMVDRVSNVVAVSSEDVQPSPQMVSGIGSEYVTGVVHEGEDYMIILDTAKLFSSHELSQIDTVAG
jgi:purine-binding chemotaxis protein CheW